MDAVKKLEKLRADEGLPPLVKAMQMEEILAYTLTDVARKMEDVLAQVQAGPSEMRVAVDALSQALAGHGVMTADLQAEVTELGKVAQDLQRTQGDILRRLPAPQHISRPRRVAWLCGGLAAVLALSSGGWVVGRGWPNPEARLFRQVHGVLGLHYKTLPKPMQEQLTTIYRQAGYQAPKGQ